MMKKVITNIFNGFSYKERDGSIKSNKILLKDSKLFCWSCNKIDLDRKKCIHFEWRKV